MVICSQVGKWARLRQAKAGQDRPIQHCGLAGNDNDDNDDTNTSNNHHNTNTNDNRKATSTITETWSGTNPPVGWPPAAC